MTRSVLLSCVRAAMLPALGQAQKPAALPGVGPGPSGFSAERLERIVPAMPQLRYDGKFPGVAVMILLEEGRFQLDDPVSRYLPRFKDVQALVGE